MVDGLGMIIALFTLAGKAVADARIDDVFAKWLKAAPRNGSVPRP